jgi:hypothetical protein
MDKQAIYRKTSKGQDEMATRTHRLPARERSVLVLVDGKRNGQELIDKGIHFGDSEAFLSHLIESGFIEPVQLAETTSAPTLTAPVQNPFQTAKLLAPVAPRIGSQAPASLNLSMAHAVAFARHFLLDTLGPDADALTARIEASRSLPELTLALDKSRDAVQVFAGKRKAELYWEELRARFPAGRQGPQ